MDGRSPTLRVIAAHGRTGEPGLLTGCLLRAANRGVPPCLSQIVLLDVAQLRLRRPIRDIPSGYLRFAALATKPGEKCGLVVHRYGSPSVSHPPILGDLGDRVDRPFDIVIGGENAGRKANGAVIVECPDAFVYLRRAM